MQRKRTPPSTKAATVERVESLWRAALRRGRRSGYSGLFPATTRLQRLCVALRAGKTWPSKKLMRFRGAHAPRMRRYAPSRTVLSEHLHKAASRRRVVQIGRSSPRTTRPTNTQSSPPGYSTLFHPNPDRDRDRESRLFPSKTRAAAKKNPAFNEGGYSRTRRVPLEGCASSLNYFRPRPACNAYA